MSKKECVEKVYKIGDMELTQNAPGELVLGQKDFHKLLDSKGVTKEVRDVVKKAETEIATDALKAANEVLIDQGLDRSEVRIGQGDGRIKIGVIGVKEMTVTNPITKEQSHLTKYGVASISVKKAFDVSIRKGILADIESDCEKAFKK